MTKLILRQLAPKVVAIKPILEKESNGVILLKHVGHLKGVIQFIGPGTENYSKDFLEGDTVVYGRPKEYKDLHLVHIDDIIPVILCREKAKESA